LRRAIAVLMFAVAASASAAESRWYVQADNDALFDTDRWYSSGLRVARVQDRGAWLLELGVVQEIYSPEGERFEFGVVDRAPAARLLLTAARHERTPRLFQTLEASAGVRGPSALGRQVTEAIHRLVTASRIEWSRQEPDRFDFQLAAVRTHHFAWGDAHYGLVAGNEVAFVHAGGELRFGARGLSSPLLRHAATPPLASEPGWGGFIGANLRGVARNEMLRRPYGAFDEPLERRNAVGRAIAGVTWSGTGFAATAALAMESREFAGQRTPHRFASLTLHAEF